jgi:hypothetical protein
VRTVRAALILAGLLLVGPGSAAEVDLTDLVSAYLKTGGAQAPGVVAARAFVEPRRPTAAASAQADVSLVLLPYSERLEAELDAVKTGLRDSVDSYVRAVTLIETARVDYERALVDAGGAALVRTGVTDAQGQVRLGDLPPGEWLLLAWREGGHVSKRHKLREADARRYPNVPPTVTYSMVTYWRSRIVVRPAATVEVAMTDRNAWMTAPRHETGPPARSRPSKAGTPPPATAPATPVDPNIRPW